MTQANELKTTLQPEDLHLIAKEFVEANRSGRKAEEISEKMGASIRAILESSEDPMTTGGDITRRIYLLLNPIEQKQKFSGILDAANTLVGGIKRDIVEKRQQEEARIKFEQKRPSRYGNDTLKREAGHWGGSNRPKKEEKSVYELLLESSGPMDTETAIGLMVKHLKLEDKALVLERFPDLKGFDGEIYFGCEMPEKDIGITLEICGVKDGKTVFFLECKYYENGWWPMKKNDTHVDYRNHNK